MNTPTILILFGATGDLIARKIVPALAHSFKQGKLPDHFAVVGFSRRPLSDEQFREHLKAEITRRAHGNVQLPDDFLQLFQYHQGLFDTAADYQSLAEKLRVIDSAWGMCSNKLFYLATPPDAYENILNHIQASGLAKTCSDEEGWTRILVEKPYGGNLENAEKLDTLLTSLFKEEQIYRIDHYLAKEMLQNIIAFRFSNNLLENIWDNRHIKRIDIRLLESIDVEGRGNFYDKVGALLDVGQNHLLQMLALVAMDQPENYAARSIRSKRAAILKEVRIPSQSEISQTTFRAQYTGYRTEKDVDPQSITETYFTIKTSINSPRWQGVDIYLEGGKKLPKVKKDIRITFKDTSIEYLHFRIQPDPGISIKLSGQSAPLYFKYPSAAESRYIEEYAKLLNDAIAGDQTLFASSDEALAGWRLVHPIIMAWRDNAVPLKTYTPENDISMQAYQTLKEKEDILPQTIGIIGLGKMGKGIALQLAEKGWQVHAWNRTAETTQEVSQANNVTGHTTVKDLIAKLPKPRIIWLMLPAGDTTEQMLFGEKGIASLLEKGDIIIDGGNAYYEDSVRRAKLLAEKGLYFLDVGTSGGPTGARNGACLMIGGPADTYNYLEPLFAALALPDGYTHMGEAGAGHFVKMVHNGIEYGMMQAIAEGFNIMKQSRFELDLEKVAHLYNKGSVIESRLVGWLESGFKEYGQELTEISGSVGYTGEGEWTVKTAEKIGVPAPIIKESFEFRVQSQANPSYIGKILSTLRNQFGGHKAKE